jgi:hypothetical protein
MGQDRGLDMLGLANRCLKYRNGEHSDLSPLECLNPIFVDLVYLPILSPAIMYHMFPGGLAHPTMSLLSSNPHVIASALALLHHISIVSRMTTNRPCEGDYVILALQSSMKPGVPSSGSSETAQIPSHCVAYIREVSTPI